MAENRVRTCLTELIDFLLVPNVIQHFLDIGRVILWCKYIQCLQTLPDNNFFTPQITPSPEPIYFSTALCSCNAGGCISEEGAVVMLSFPHVQRDMQIIADRMSAKFLFVIIIISFPLYLENSSTFVI